MTLQTRLPPSLPPLVPARRAVRPGLGTGSADLVPEPPLLPAASPEIAERHCHRVRSRIIRNGVLVVGGSVLASVSFTEAAFHMVGTDSYLGSMIAAAVIPLLVAGPVYGWIAALTLRLEASNTALDRLAHTDPLTGIANRRAAMTTLAEWSSAPASTAAPARGCVIAIVDIDDFKCINDRFGHDTGDAALCHVALMLEQLAREGWLVARIGGEEFLLAAPGNSARDLAAFAAGLEAIRTSLAATPLITPAGPHRVTASFGFAAGQAGEPLKRLLGRADRALYRAKETGRNRIEMAG
ncbi:MAG: GGDEF domain-containing protein [Erythrobacter sp.]